jgi:anti-anti-sigma factor
MYLTSWLPFSLFRPGRVTRPAEQQFPPASTPKAVSPGDRTANQPRPASRLEIEVQTAPQGRVVRLRGEAGVAEAGILEASLLPLVAARPACVTFDLSQLVFISSLAMGALVTYRRAAVRAGSRVCLLGELAPAVREALERAELLGLFEVAGAAPPGSEPAPATACRRTGYPSLADVQRIHGVTWAELVEGEPEVEPLLWLARRAGAGCRTLAAVDRAFVPVRTALARLIGFTSKHRRHPVLGSVGAYEVACWKLYDAVAGSLPAVLGGVP